jgi:hypothetical protein
MFLIHMVFMKLYLFGKFNNSSHLFKDLVFSAGETGISLLNGENCPNSEHIWHEQCIVRTPKRTGTLRRVLSSE